MILTYRWSHRSPQPWLPLQTAERETVSPMGPPGTHRMGTCLPFPQHTHLFSFHLRSDHGPIGADDDAGLPLLPLQERRRHKRRWRDQAPSHSGAGVTTGTPWPGRMRDQECDHPTRQRRPEAVTFNPGEPWGPDDPRSPFGPTGPCRQEHRARVSPNAPKADPKRPLHHHHPSTNVAKCSRTGHQRFPKSMPGTFTRAIPAVPSPATNSPGSQRDPVCPVGRSRDACKSNFPLSKKPGAHPALLRFGCGL